MTMTPETPIEPAPEAAWVEIRRIAGCTLELMFGNDDPDRESGLGRWYEATCREYSMAIAGAGGLRNLHVYSTVARHPETQETFCEWGTKDGHRPVAASGGECQDGRYGKPCNLIHAVFFPPEPKEGEK